VKLTNYTHLFLDLGTKTGYVLANVETMLDTGVMDFSRAKKTRKHAGDHPGATYLKFQLWLDRMARSHQHLVFHYEHVTRWQGYQAAHVYGGLRGSMFAVAALRGLPEPRPYAVTLIKQNATGKGNANKGMIQEAMEKKYPIRVKDDNHADALAIYDLFCELNPLFRIL
jgi:Holliday junction resolvasome RuvABC endonuclease subunit